jgi:hypothetical protein
LEEKKGRREDAGCADFDGEETPASVGDLEKRTWREDAGLAEFDVEETPAAQEHHTVRQKHFVKHTYCHLTTISNLWLIVTYSHSIV